MCYDGVKYDSDGVGNHDYVENETTEAEETLNEPSNISLWEVNIYENRLKQHI